MIGSHIRGRLPSLILICAGALAGGCQEEDGFPLTPSSFPLHRALAAKGTFYEPCIDLPERQLLVQEMLQAVNAERVKHKLGLLRLDDTLTQLADFYACRLVEGGFFDHADPFDGSTVDTRAADFGYAFLKIGENLAAGQRSVEETFSDWMASPAHRANILDPAFTEIGISVKDGGGFGPYWVQEFGRPITASVELDVGPWVEQRTPAGSSHNAASQPVSEHATSEHRRTGGAAPGASVEPTTGPAGD